MDHRSLFHFMISRHFWDHDISKIQDLFFRAQGPSRAPPGSSTIIHRGIWQLKTWHVDRCLSGRPAMDWWRPSGLGSRRWSAGARKYREFMAVYENRVPKNWWFIQDNPIKNMDDICRGTPILGNLHTWPDIHGLPHPVDHQLHWYIPQWGDVVSFFYLSRLHIVTCEAAVLVTSGQLILCPQVSKMFDRYYVHSRSVSWGNIHLKFLRSIHL